jgi:hypothetical protein
MIEKNTVSALKKNLLPLLIIVGFATGVNAQTGCTIPVGTSVEQIRKILNNGYQPLPFTDFFELKETTKSQNAILVKRLQVLEKTACWRDSTLDKYWTELYESKVVIYENKIDRADLEHEELFANNMMRHFQEIERNDKKLDYRLKNTGKLDSFTRTYTMLIAPKKFTLYFSPDTATSEIIHFKILTQFAITRKTLIETPGLPKQHSGSGGPFINRPESIINLPELNGRKLLYKPPFYAITMDKAILNFNVCVLPDGSVESVEYTVKGSTTQNNTLKEFAQKTAKKLKFSPAAATECYLIGFDFK